MMLWTMPWLWSHHLPARMPNAPLGGPSRPGRPAGREERELLPLRLLPSAAASVGLDNSDEGGALTFATETRREFRCQHEGRKEHDIRRNSAPAARGGITPAIP